MDKTKKLWKPFSDVLRKALPSTCRLEASNYNYNFTSRIRLLSSSFSSSVQEYSFGRRQLSSENLGFCGRTFCSVTAEKVHNATCWNCNEAPKAVPFLFCNSCRSVQPVDHSVDYFQIFGL